jgi:hypothetical protein
MRIKEDAASELFPSLFPSFSGVRVNLGVDFSDKAMFSGGCRIRSPAAIE